MATFIWLVLLVGIYVICLWWIPRMKDGDNKAPTIFVSFFGFVICSKLLLTVPATMDSRSEYSGVPITTGLISLEGRTFTPQAFVVTEQRIMVYDRDNRVYALDGISFEKGLAPENLTVGTNITYIVYRRGSRLEFGRL